MKRLVRVLGLGVGLALLALFPDLAQAHHRVGVFHHSFHHAPSVVVAPGPVVVVPGGVGPHRFFFFSVAPPSTFIVVNPQPQWAWRPGFWTWNGGAWAWQPGQWVLLSQPFVLRNPCD